MTALATASAPPPAPADDLDPATLQRCLQRLAAARRKASGKMPYLTMALMVLVPVPVRGLGTVAVSERAVMSYDPETILAWSVDDLATGLVHEVSHLLRRHFPRAVTAGATTTGELRHLWNLATDAEINDDLKAAGMAMLDTDVLPARFTPKLPDGKLAEFYYQELRKRPKAPPPPQGKPRPGGGLCGGCCGNPVPGEVRPDKGGAGGADPDPNAPGANPTPVAVAGGRSESELDTVRKGVALAVQKAAANAKAAGTVGAGWKVWAEAELAPPRVDWRAVLRSVCAHGVATLAGAGEATWRQTSRRQAGIGYGVGKPRLAGLHLPTPTVAVVVDTSGSMGSGAGSDTWFCVSEIAGLLKTLGVAVEWLSGDTDVRSSGRARRWEAIAEGLAGGGGTVLEPLIRAALDPDTRKRLGVRTPPPDLVLILTDAGLGDSRAFTHPAGAAPEWTRKAVWCVPVHRDDVDPERVRPASWGRCVVIHRDRETGQEV